MKHLTADERKALTDEELRLWTELLASGEAEGTKGILLHRLAAAQGMIAAVRRWAEGYAGWTPEEHDAFLATLEEQR